MPINNKEHVSPVQTGETANVKWLYYKYHSVTYSAQGFNAGYHSLMPLERLSICSLHGGTESLEDSAVTRLTYI